MSYYQVRVQVNGRDLEMFAREGVPSTIEVGSHKDRVKTPQHKVSIIAGQTNGKATAWVQIAEHSSGALSVSHVGWVDDSNRSVKALFNAPAAAASVSKVDRLPENTIRTLEKAQFGTDGCCTSYGNGCYVTCCNGCCSDPVGCPGASCCA